MARFTRRTPRFQLTGLAATPDGLYDGSFVGACCGWWNHEVTARPDLRQAGYRPFSADEVRKLAAVPLPEDRALLEAVASSVSLPGRQSAAVLALAHAFAVIVEAAAAQVLEDFRAEVASTRAPRPLTPDDLTELSRHYSDEGAAREYALWMPYWHLARSLLADKVAEKTIRSLKAAFDDQVDRWSTAEGVELRRSLGAPDYSLIAADEGVGLPDFVELLFEWGGRLRLGERLITEGCDFRDLRFDQEDFDPIDHFYAEAYERYLRLASQEPPPISADVEMAARMCAAWLGDKLDGRARLAISTAAIRAYLWRTVEDGPVDFLEPKLTEAVQTSLTVGADRSPDEPRGITLYFAASQCMVDDVHTRLGSIGGLIKGPRSYEKAFSDTLDDFVEVGFDLDENTRRLAFQFGMCLADSERALGRAFPATPA